jgi:hypothetical protein
VKLQHTLALAGLLALVAGPSASGSTARTITTIAKGTGITFVDADHSRKPSAGDYEIGTSVYLHPGSGKAIGRSSVVCVQLDAAGTKYQCQGSSHFAGGDVITAGRFSPAARSGSQAILGGTGVYAGATGAQAITWLDAHFGRARVVFRFSAYAA